MTEYFCIVNAADKEDAEATAKLSNSTVPHMDEDFRAVSKKELIDLLCEWEPISTAPTDGPFLVKGGSWVGEWSGTQELKPDDVHLVDGFCEYQKGFPVSATECYSPRIKEPTHWKHA